MDVRLAVPETTVSAEVLEPALETITRLNERLISSGRAPTFEKALSEGRVKWKPEPPGAERFDHAGIVYGRGHGDCDDLAPWHAASLRVTGEDKGAQARIYQSGPGRWHAVTERSNGDIEDPSLAAGMRKHKGIVGVAPACVSPMFGASISGDHEIRPSIALRPNRRLGAWEGRSDMPWSDSDGYAMSVLSRNKSPRAALVGSILGACLVGECSGFADEDHMDRLRMIAGLLCGGDPHELAATLGEDLLVGVLPAMQAISPQVGFDFGGLIKSVAPFVSKAVALVPGAGGKLAAGISSAAGIAQGFMRTGAAQGASHAQVTEAVRAAAARPDVSAANAANVAKVQAALRSTSTGTGARVHQGATMTEDDAPVFRPIPKGAGYIHVPGGPVILRF